MFQSVWFKIEIIWHELINEVNRFGILSLSEIKLDKYDNVDMNGYVFISCIRDNAKNSRGGIVILFKNKLQQLCNNCSQTKHALLLNISKEVSGLNMLLVGVYIPPEGSIYFDDHAFSEIQTAIFC